MTALSFHRTPHLAWRRIGDEFVVVNLAAKEMIGLDATGGALFERLSQPRTPATLAALFEGVPGERTEAIASFCEALARIGVLEQGAADTERGSEQGGRLPWNAPTVLWREPLTAIVNQASPPPALGNPQCGF